MNKNDLQVKLDAEGFRPFEYSIDGKAILEGFCLEPLSSNWRVYFLERGIEREIIYFNDETDACEYIYQRLAEDRE